MSTVQSLKFGNAELVISSHILLPPPNGEGYVWECDYLSMLGIQLIRVSKRDPYVQMSYSDLN